MKKKLLCVILAALMVLSIMPASAFAANVKCERPLQFEENIATELKKLNLFKGVSETDFALRKVPTRIEALVIMLRLMGKEAEILAGSYKHPFTDVPSWANNYVGYAYENGLTKGISASKFGTDNATDVQFLTFVLRAMGYSDSNGDFTWDNPYKLAEDLGVLDCSVTTGKGFLRADCASISYNALSAKLKDSTKTLADKLIAEGVFTKSAYDSAVKNVPDYAGMMKAYGLQNMKWNEYPKTDIEYSKNFLLAYLAGAWQLDTEKNWEKVCTAKWSKRLGSSGELASVYAALLGEWLNCFNCHAYLSNDGTFYIYTDGEVPYYIKDELVSHVTETYIAACELKKQFKSFSNGKDCSTDLVLAKVYYDFLVSNVNVPHNQLSPAEKNYREKHPEIGDVDFARYIEQNTAASIVSLAGDGAYNLLINNRGECGPHACLFNIMLNMEDIETYGICGSDTGGGHIVSYLVIDGNAYVCDWGNKRGICAINNCEKELHFLPNEYSLRNVEIARFNGDLSKVGKEYYGNYRQF